MGRSILKYIYNLYLILFLFTSCSQINETKSDDLVYFDLKSYFINEASKLTSQNLPIHKEISKNEQKESKLITIKDWQKEFDLFIESDINKPSWSSSYEIKTNGDTIVYKALTADLRTRVIQIIKNDNKIRSVLIKNESLNRLYKSYECLSYYPDSIYIIEKEQQVRFLGDNSYKIIGSFN